MIFRSFIILSLIFSIPQSSNKFTLVASKTLPQIKIPQALKLTVFADHKSHGVFSPTALTIDEKNRVLIAETWRFMNNRGVDDNRKRLHWIHDDLASQTTADRLAMYQKWYHKHPPEHYTKHSEKIRMLIDEDGDGAADKHTVFAEQFNAPLDGTAAGIFSYEGNVYFACLPNIWLLNDDDDDGVADKRTSLQEGFGVRVSFSGHDLNGFVMGPDGRIYATVGDRGFNIKTKEGKHYAYPDQGAILRFDPDGSNMEVIHTGLRNPKEIAFDQYGNAITVDNNSDQRDKARVVYIMEGADSGWSMGSQVMHSFHRVAGMKKRPINRWMAEKMWEPKNNAQPAYIVPPIKNLTNGPSGLTYHPGPDIYPGKIGHFLVSDYRGSATRSNITSFGVANDGAGMRVTEDFIFNNSVGSTDVEYGYDGKVYVSDFISGWSAHAGGRIYTLEKADLEKNTIIKQTQELIAKDFTTIAPTKLIELMSYPDMRIRLRAQLALVKINNVDHFETAWEMYQKKNHLLAKLHTIWGLGILSRGVDDSARLAATVLVRESQHENDMEVKAQIAKCLGEAGQFEKISLPLSLLLNHESPRVQSFAAIALGKRKHTLAFEALVKLAERNANKDHYLRHAAIMGLLGTGTEEKILSLKTHKSPAVRLAAVVALRRLKSTQVHQFLKDEDNSVRDETIRVIHDLQLIDQQGKVAALIGDLSVKDLTPMLQRRLINSAFRVGGNDNIKKLLLASTRSDYHIDQRREALRLLSLWETPPTIDQALGRWSPLPDIASRKSDHLAEIISTELPEILTDQNPLTAELLQLVSQYKINLKDIPSDRLQRIMRNSKLPGATRAAALKAITLNPYEGLNKELIKLAKNKKTKLAIAALTQLNQLYPSDSDLTILASTQIKKPMKLRQAAWRLLEKADDINAIKHIANAIQELTKGKGDQECAIEIIAAAEAHQHPTIIRAFKLYQDSLDKKNPLHQYLSTLQGGDSEEGKALFISHATGQCMRCHTTEKNHDLKMAGPNLSGLAKRGDRMFILESLIIPNAKIANGFGAVSAMPPMGLLMKKSEIRDLVAYLSTLK